MKNPVTQWLMVAGIMASCLGRAAAQAPFTGGLYPSGKQQAVEGAMSLYYFDYNEGLTPPLKSEEKGWMPSFHGSWTLRRTSPGLFARVGVDFTKANTTYDGSTQDSLGNVYPYLGTTQNTLLNTFGNIGVSFMNLSNPPRTLTAYTGIGYRLWHRGVAGSGGYREFYSWKYVPVGLRLDYRANSELSGAVEASARIMFGGGIKVYFSDYDPSFSDFSMTLGNRPGLKVEAPIYYQMWSLTPWLEYSAIGQSDTVTILRNGTPWGYAYEPSSTTHQFGVKVGLRLEF